MHYDGIVQVDDITALNLLEGEKKEAIMSIEEIEKQKIKALLRKVKKTEISSMLGISRATFIPQD